VIPELRPDAQVGKYRIVRHLGQGGMGSVFQAVHVDIAKEVALKVLTADLANDPRAKARFLQEAASLSRLNHPHVVVITDYGAEADTPYIVMELLKGQNLSDRLWPHRRSGIPVEQAVEILLAVSTGITAAHHAGLVHRDIKPSNIFLAESPLKEIQPKLIDFGIAKSDGEMSDSRTKNIVVGTPNYLAPEQVRGFADARSDQFSLAVVLYECLTGRLPHEGGTPFEVMRNVEAGNFRPPSEFRADLPPELETVILRALSRHPDARFEHVFDFGKALLPFASARQRAIWSRFFSDDMAAAVTGSSTAPLPVSTSLLPVATKEQLPSGGGPMAESWFASSQTAEPAPAKTPPSRWRQLGMGLLAVGAMAAGAIAIGTSGILRPTGWPTTVDKGPKTLAGTQPSSLAAEPLTLAAKVTINLVGLPPDARVLLDGAPQSLPLHLDRDERARELAIHAVGFETEVRQIVPSADQTLRIQLRPVPEAAEAPRVSINIDSLPQGAEIWVDGESASVGPTPRALYVPRSSEPRRITLRLPGYLERSIIFVPDGDRMPDVVRLVRSPVAAKRKLTKAPRRMARPLPEPPAESSYIRLPD
jgi:serine/threonine-protein kinase